MRKFILMFAVALAIGACNTDEHPHETTNYGHQGHMEEPQDHQEHGDHDNINSNNNG